MTDRRGRAARRATTLAALALLAGGCALGPRPTLTTETKLDDTAIEAVLDRFARARTATFTATYTITSTMVGAQPVTATVAHHDAFTEATIGQVQYTDRDGAQRTCTVDAADCVAGLDETRVSDLNITSAFWADSAAARLNGDARRNIAGATATAPVIAGQTATCATVPLVGGSVEYCALDAGPLARYTGADVTIVLTDWQPSAPA